MAARRSNFDIIGRWLFLVVLPWLVLALPRFIHLLWSLLIRATEEQVKVPGKDFYSTAAWRKARMLAMERNMQVNGGRLRCRLCKRTEEQGVTSWHGGHIKSRSNWPELALEPSNICVLCSDCNLGAGNLYEDLKLTRCRRKAA